VVRKLLLAAAAIIAGVAVFGAFYWVQSTGPATPPSELRTGSLWVRVATANTTYTAGETVRIDLSVKNMGAQPLSRPTKITVSRLNSKGEYVPPSCLIINDYFYEHLLALPPGEEHQDHVDVLVDPSEMPPGRYTITITLAPYALTLATHITVE
jgi:uncharacterized membrane protein